MKMKKTAIVSLLVVFSSPYALAGTVEFAPSEQTVPPGLVSVVVSVQTTIPDLIGIDSADIVIGSELPVVSLTYSDPNTFETVYPPALPGIYPHNVWAGASNTRPDSGGDSHLIVPAVFPVSIGMLVVDATGAADGDYTVWVDTAQDNCSGLGATVLTKGISGVVVSEPLSGDAVIHVRSGVPVVSADPPCDSSLIRAHDNCVKLTFGDVIPAPNPGDIKIQRLLAGGAYDPTDLSNQFTFTVVGGNVLKIKENGDVLSNQTWYAIRNTGSWAGAAPFKLDYRVVYGDVDNNGSTTAADASDVWGSRGPAPDDCSRYDIDANGSITASDASDAWGFRGSTAGPKPSGHTCSP